jgi:hypothetical protein
MARQKNGFPSKRIRLDGLLRMKGEKKAVTERDQKFLDWYLDHQDSGKRFNLAKEIITAMLNGELGARVQDAVAKGNTEEALEAARDLISDYVIE